jgi:predicted proteasome-type protease
VPAVGRQPEHQQSVREILQVEKLDRGVRGAAHHLERELMFDAARVLGSAVRRIYERDGDALKHAGVDFNVSHDLRRPDQGRGMRLFQVYSAGNFIEATRETRYFQIGESKYGKPVLDRVITPNTPLDEARQVRAGVDGLDAQVQPLGRPAAGPGWSTKRTAASPATSMSASTSTTPTSA